MTEQQVINATIVAMRRGEEVMKQGMAERDALQARLDALVAAAEAAVSRLSDAARDATEHGDPLWNLGEPGCDAMLWLEGAIRAAKGVRS